MDYKYYERKINDIIMKCPIEAGVEILVYNLLDNIINAEKLSLVDINSIRKDRDRRLTTEGGIPDIAILSNDFRFGEDEEETGVYGFVEIKATNISLHITAQIEGQKNKIKHYLYTNGLVWKYFKNKDKEWEIKLTIEQYEKMNYFSTIEINSDRFDELIKNIKKIDWIK